MTATAFSRPESTPFSDRRRDALWALLGVLVMLAVYAAGRFATLADLDGDNDSLLRLVQVRDLLAGQGWFDLHQYRMGPEGGFVMHWSRLVDAPIAGIIALVTAMSGSSVLGETLALIAWPLLLAFVSLFLILRAVRRFAGEAAMLPALVIGGCALYFIGVFKPATLDHHNVQVALALVMLACLLDPRRRLLTGFLAGTAGALMMAVGMETLPYVAAGGLIVALLFVFGDDDDRTVARGFGLGFAGVGAIAFVATVPSVSWGAAECDAYSIAQFAVAAVGGAGLALATSLGTASRTMPRRLAAMAILGILVAVLVIIAFPQCLADPYASLDPRLKTRWLDLVNEAQPLWKIIEQNPGMAVARYVTPLIGLVLACTAAFRRTRRREDVVVAALLAITFAVSVWQVRGTTLAIVIAVLPLSAWIGRVRTTATTMPSRRATLTMAAAWLASFNITWAGAAAGAETLFEKKPLAGETAFSACTGEKDYARLAAMPKATLLAVSNLGAPILRYSPHHVFAGPYHRNVVGNLIAIDAFLGPIDRAETIAQEHHVDFVVSCRGNDETKVFADWAPEGLAAALLKDEPPAWLELVPETRGEAVQLYKVLR